MAWGKVDDKLHASVKWRRASKGGRALWTTALSWCSDQENDGRVPMDMLRILDGTPADARSLVHAGLWDATEDGWIFHDWTDYNPDSASVKAKRDAESQGGKRGNHTRWHVAQGVTVPDCEFCNPTNPDQPGESGGDRVPESGANPPVPTRPDPSQNNTSPTSRFDEFWDAYGKKVGRKKAEQKWAIALRKVTADNLIAAAASYVEGQKRAGKFPEFTKDPATWLNGEHWNDEPARPSNNVHALRPSREGIDNLPIDQQLALYEKGQWS